MNVPEYVWFAVPMVASVVAGVIAWGGWTSGAADAERWNAAIEQMMQVERLQWRQRLEVAKARGNPMADYDRLVHASNALVHHLGAVSARGEALTGEGEVAGPMLLAYTRAVERQGEAVERFKTSYAITRNSRRFLPIAATEAADGARAAGQDALARQLAQSERHLREWMVSIDAAMLRRAVEALDRVRTHASSVAASAYAPKIKRYVAHAEVLLDNWSNTADLLAEAAAERHDGRAQLLTELRRKRAEASARERRATIAMATSGIVLAGVAVVFVLVYAHRYRRLQSKAHKAQPAAERKAGHEADLEEVLFGVLRFYADVGERSERPAGVMGDADGERAQSREDDSTAAPHRADTDRTRIVPRPLENS